MTRKKDDKQIIEEFKLRQSRQLLAIAVTLVLLLLLALLYKRTDLFGEISKNAVFALQVILISAFIGFSAVNWRCPLCNRYLGHNIYRRICRRCGTRLQ